MLRLNQPKWGFLLTPRFNRPDPLVHWFYFVTRNEHSIRTLQGSDYCVWFGRRKYVPCAVLKSPPGYVNDDKKQHIPHASLLNDIGLYPLRHWPLFFSNLDSDHASYSIHVNDTKKWNNCPFSAFYTRVNVSFKNSRLLHMESRRSNSVPGDQEDMCRHGNSHILSF